MVQVPESLESFCFRMVRYDSDVFLWGAVFGIGVNNVYDMMADKSMCRVISLMFSWLSGFCKDLWAEFLFLVKRLAVRFFVI